MGEWEVGMEDRLCVVWVQEGDLWGGLEYMSGCFCTCRRDVVEDKVMQSRLVDAKRVGLGGIGWMGG